MKEFGDCIGICMYYQTADDQAGDIADEELKKNPKKKKEQLVSQYKKDYNLREQLRALIFKEGVCVSESNQLDKDKIKLNIDGKYYIFVGANGPCSVSVNIGGKVFRAHHDEISKGVISTVSLSAKPLT